MGTGDRGQGFLIWRRKRTGSSGDHCEVTGVRAVLSHSYIFNSGPRGEGKKERVGDGVVGKLVNCSGSWLRIEDATPDPPVLHPVQEVLLIEHVMGWKKRW